MTVLHDGSTIDHTAVMAECGSLDGWYEGVQNHETVHLLNTK